MPLGVMISFMGSNAASVKIPSLSFSVVASTDRKATKGEAPVSEIRSSQTSTPSIRIL